MANPSAAHEPSMEEILASIRQIISEDGDGGRAQDAKGAKAEETGYRPPERQEEPADAGPQAIALEEADIEPEPEPEFEHEPEPASSFVHGVAMTPHSTAAAAEADPYTSFGESSHRQPKPGASQHHDFGSDAQRLLSSESDSAVHGAFSALAHTILAQNARTLEDLVAEMLQPMLKTWLDENLPQLVERLVQEEIQRVSRGKR